MGLSIPSFLSEARLGIVRSGTPPLLLGSRAIGTGLSEYDQGNHPDNDDQDWETMADSNGRSRRKFGDIETAARAGSRIADVSDSSNVTALRSVATGQALVRHIRDTSTPGPSCRTLGAVILYWLRITLVLVCSIAEYLWASHTIVSIS